MNAAYQVAQQPVTAQAFYAAACDPQRSVVVEACAGAGKTWMLVSRILRALQAGALPQQILAITFTRKAAGEMRERLEDWLAEFSQERSTADQRVQALVHRGLSLAQAQAAQQDLGALHERLLRVGRRVEVRTFHAWFGQLLAHAPMALLQRLGLPAAYEVIEDTAQLRDALFRRFHRAVQADAALRADYMELVRLHRRSTLLMWLGQAWFKGPELARADAAGTAATAVPAAATVWPACAGLSDPAQLLVQAPLSQDLAELARLLGRSDKATPRKAAEGLQQALALDDPVQVFAGAWAALFTSTGTLRKFLGDSALLAAVAASLEQVAPMRRQQAAHQDHQRLLRLSRVLLSEYAALKRQRGLLDMADLERAAEALLGDSELAGWVQQRLDQRVRHLLIDEFQDTSPLQWQVLQGWLSGYAGAGGGASGQQPLSVFIVGDPKQSIYRFRGAEPKVFTAATDFVVQALDGLHLACDHTRRNAAAVVAAVNSVFTAATQTQGWGPFRAHSTASEAAGEVRHLSGALRPIKVAGAADLQIWRDSLTEPRSEPELRLQAQEAEQVAQAASALITQHGLAPGEVMVLARKRAVLAQVALALARAQVPHVVAEALALHESPEALDLVAVLDVLTSAGHNLSLARALRSPLFSASDDDLLWLSLAAREEDCTWRQALLSAEAPPSNALQRAQTLLAQWLSVAPSLPPHDLLDRIVADGDVMARLAAAVPAARRGVASHAVQSLLAAALEQDGGRFSSVYGFVRQVRAGRVRMPGVAPADAVQLLTVHGAKGLEARAVIVADCEPAKRPADRVQVLVDWPVELSAPRSVAFVRTGADLPPSAEQVFAEQEQAQAREDLNGLYVAMTRAREWLVLSRTEARNTPPLSWWAQALPAAMPWQPELSSAAGVVSAPSVAVMPQWQAGASTTVKTSPDDARAARLGQAVHRVLEWAAGSATEPDLAALSTAAAAAFGLPAGAAHPVRHLANAVLTSPACARFFRSANLHWAGNEVPLSWQGQALRVDRLVALQEDSGLTWWVLDYKLQSDPAAVQAYREQMRSYVAAVQALQPLDAVRGAFITGQGVLVEAD